MILKRELGDYIRPSYLSYALDVVQARAIPDARDGLKPVHRRILQSAYDLGLGPTAKHKKSARLVGDVLGRYHPHSDASVYDAEVVLAQDFKERYPLIDIMGNAGSVDGDPAAAMRYTEVRMSRYGSILMENIEKDTVDMQPNYDNTIEEPTVLPGLFPNLLLNGTSGVAVGVAADFQPHCAKSIYGALDKMLDDAIKGDETSLDDLISIVRAPDFPTGGIIVNADSLREAYATGKGRVIVRAKYEIEEISNDKHRMVITEIPFRVNKAKLVAKIAELKSNGTIEDIASVSDESNRDGLRVVIDFKAKTNIDWVVNMLLKKTELQKSLPFHHVAIVVDENGKPVPKENLSLKDLLESFLLHAVNVTRRAVEFDVNKAQKRMHIVSALGQAVGQADEVWEINKSAKTKKDAVEGVQQLLNVDEEQATAIVDLHLWSMNEDSLGKLQKEYDDLSGFIGKCEEILGDQTILLAETRQRLKETYEKNFKDDCRRTEISTEEIGSTDIRDFVQEEDIVITYTHNQMIKSVRLADYKSQRRNGVGTTLQTKEDDFVEQVNTLSTKDNLVFITNKGRAYVLPAFRIPISGRNAQPKYLVNYISFDEDEHLLTMLPIKHEGDEDKALFFVTKNGLGKRLKVTELPQTRSGARVISFREGDELASCVLTEDDDQVLIVSADGLGLRTAVNNFREMGRVASGVVAMRFKNEADCVVATTVIKSEEDKVCVLTQGGFGKRIAVKDIASRDNKGGKGVIVYKPNNVSGGVAAVLNADDEQTIIAVTSNGMVVRTEAKGISVMGTTARGVHVVKLQDGDSIATAVDAPEEGNSNE